MPRRSTSKRAKPSAKQLASKKRARFPLRNFLAGGKVAFDYTRTYSQSTYLADGTRNPDKRGLYKPCGLWYSIGDAWHRFCVANDFGGGGGGYLHRLDLKRGVLCSKLTGSVRHSSRQPLQLLVLNTVKDIKAFYRRYGEIKKSYTRVHMRLRVYAEGDHTSEKNRCPTYYSDGRIRWKEVARDYAGIEFRNYDRNKSELLDKHRVRITYKRLPSSQLVCYMNYTPFSWYYELDASSGCIWTLDIVKAVVYVGKVG